MEDIDRIVTQVNNLADKEAREAALHLVQAVMELHATAIERIMEIASDAGDPGWAIIDEFARDPRVSNVLLLHDLHPIDIETRVRTALDEVRPYLRSHGGDVELISIDGTAVLLKLIGNCNACPSSALTMKTAIEKSIRSSAPDVTSIECEGDTHGASTPVSVSGAA